MNVLFVEIILRKAEAVIYYAVKVIYKISYKILMR